MTALSVIVVSSTRVNLCLFVCVCLFVCLCVHVCVCVCGSTCISINSSHLQNIVEQNYLKHLPIYMYTLPVESDWRYVPFCILSVCPSINSILCKHATVNFTCQLLIIFH